MTSIHTVAQIIKTLTDLHRLDEEIAIAWVDKSFAEERLGHMSDDTWSRIVGCISYSESVTEEMFQRLREELLLDNYLYEDVDKRVSAEKYLAATSSDEDPDDVYENTDPKIIQTEFTEEQVNIIKHSMIQAFENIVFSGALNKKERL